MKKSPAVFMAVVVCMFIAASLYAQELSMPGMSMLDSLKDTYEAVRFDHATHTSMASGCGTCHHQHGEDTRTCQGCHSLGPDDFRQSVKSGFLSCKTCHGTYDPAHPAMPGLKAAYHRQCFVCHAGMGSLGLDPRGCTKQCHAIRAAG